MRPRNESIFYLMLLPAPWFCADFVPVWLMWALSALILLRVWRPIPNWVLIPASVALGYFCFQEYGRRLVPESAISFLNVMIMAKIAQKEGSFRSNLILGTLWAGSFAIFNNTLYYLLYLALFFLMTLHLLGRRPERAFRLELKRISLAPLGSLAKTLPLIVALFLFFPRFRGFLPSAASGPNLSQIGYSKKIDNSNSGNLNLSSKTAFFANTAKRLSPDELYWRGRVHTYTDGYNWRPAQMAPEKELPVAGDSTSLKYEIKYQQDLDEDVVLLETPIRIEAGARSYKLAGTNTYRTYIRDKKLNITAVSNPGGFVRSSLTKNRDSQLKLPGFLPNSFKAIANSITEKTPSGIINNFSNYLNKNGYQYTLSPGPMPALGDFIENKKGFCTHYASLLAILLRYKGIPARVVSGFQGGEYNEAGGFYTVRSNDAHAWVEYHDNGRWNRADPTSFISPARIQQGGELYLVQSEASPWRRFTGRLNFFKSWDQAIANINFKIAAFFDDFDRQTQIELAQKLKLDLKTFYWLGLVIAVLILAGIFFLIKRSRKITLAPEDLEFRKFEQKLRKANLEVSPSLSEKKLELLCEKNGLPAQYVEFLRLYQQIKYKGSVELRGELGELTKKL